MPSQVRRYLHDETSSDNSTISSASGIESLFSGTGGTWSLPRNRPSNGRGEPEGPRRSGSAFRVSMRPKGSRQNFKDGFDDDRSGRRSRRFVCFLAGVSLIGVAYRTLEPTTERTNVLHGIFDELSTEDLVAQGEMSAASSEEFLLMSLPTAKPGTKEDVKTNFHGTLSNEQQALIDELSRLAELSLRGNSLEIVEDEDKLPPRVDLVINLDSYNATGHIREDWGPSVKKRDLMINQTVVAYILPVFSCYHQSEEVSTLKGSSYPRNDREFMDAALMLQASIHRNSARTPRSQSGYNYEMVSLVHASVETCSGGANRTGLLERIGYRVEVVREPIHAANIANAYLQKHAPQNNAENAGLGEMIRLYAFKMIEYRLTVLVDFTTFILRPPDAIFDALLNGPRGHHWAESTPSHFVRDTFYPNGTISHSESLPIEVDIMFTRDYSSMPKNSWTTGISLAFVPIRPSMETYERLIHTYQSVDYDAMYGWDGKGYAHYEGSMQTKGLLTFFFSEIEPDRKLELHRCIYNNLADVPFVAGDDRESSNCRDVKEHKLQPDGSAMPCTDCRTKSLTDIVVANFAMCRPPWICPLLADTAQDSILSPTLQMCRMFHQKWFELRRVIEDSVFDQASKSKATGTFHTDIFHGYCESSGLGDGIYEPMVSTIRFPHGLGEYAFPAR